MTTIPLTNEDAHCQFGERCDICSGRTPRCPLHPDGVHVLPVDSDVCACGFRASTARHVFGRSSLPEPVLSEAQRLISTDRNESYGPFAEDFGRTVAIFNAWTGHNLSVADGIRFMRAVKMSREIASPLRDNLVDGAGYIGGQAQVEGFDA